MEADRYAEEAAILDQFLSSNKLTEREAWDRLIGVLYEARDLDDGEFAAQVDPLNEAEVLLDLVKLNPRLGFLRMLFENDRLNLKSILVDRKDPLEVLPYLHLLVRPLLGLDDWGDEDREPPASTPRAPPLAEYGLSLVQGGAYSFKRWSAAMLEKFPEDADAIQDRLRDIHDEVMEQFEELERPFNELARLQVAGLVPGPELALGTTPLTQEQIRQAVRVRMLREAEKNAREAEEELRALGFYDLAEGPPDSAN